MSDLEQHARAPPRQKRPLPPTPTGPPRRAAPSPQRGKGAADVQPSPNRGRHCQSPTARSNCSRARSVNTSCVSVRRLRFVPSSLPPALPSSSRGLFTAAFTAAASRDERCPCCTRARSSCVLPLLPLLARADTLLLVLLLPPLLRLPMLLLSARVLVLPLAVLLLGDAGPFAGCACCRRSRCCC